MRRRKSDAGGATAAEVQREREEELRRRDLAEARAHPTGSRGANPVAEAGGELPAMPAGAEMCRRLAAYCGEQIPRSETEVARFLFQLREQCSDRLANFYPEHMAEE